LVDTVFLQGLLILCISHPRRKITAHDLNSSYLRSASEANGTRAHVASGIRTAPKVSHRPSMQISTFPPST